MKYTIKAFNGHVLEDTPLGREFLRPCLCCFTHPVIINCCAAEEREHNNNSFPDAYYRELEHLKHMCPDCATNYKPIFDDNGFLCDLVPRIEDDYNPDKLDHFEFLDNFDEDSTHPF